MPELPLLGGLPATGLPLLAAEFAITIADPAVWQAIGLALMIGALCLAFGTWVARVVGLLPEQAPAGETLAVGLASGLIVLAAWWAAMRSRGQSSFTPVAIGFAIAIALAVLRRSRPSPREQTSDNEGTTPSGRQRSVMGRFLPRRSLVLTSLAGGLFIVAIALLYGSTLAPSPRDGVQPVEFSDAAFYSILGRDLATTGTETNLLPSGFADLPELPSQTWYHWGEVWLASAVITVFGTTPLAARHFIVLPLVLLAAAALTGTLVRRVTRTTSRWAYAFGLLACLFLAPVALPGTFFSSWPAGLLFGITLYGLGAIVILLALYVVSVIDQRQTEPSFGIFVGSTIGSIVPAHVVIAVTAVVGFGAVSTIRTVSSVIANRRLPILRGDWQWLLIASGAALIAALVWGLLTGHGLSSSASTTNVSAFNLNWQYSVAFTFLGGGTLLAILVVPLLLRKSAPRLAHICLGVIVVLAFGATAWGARIQDFNMFHVFYGGIATLATPVAAVTLWFGFEHLRRAGHSKAAFGLIILCASQLVSGVVSSSTRLQEFGPRLDQQPVSVGLLAAIRQLPSDAKLAYSCRPFEEISFVDSSLLSIDAHTGRRIVPMCFEADVFSTLTGAPPSAQVAAAGFTLAPQRILYPDASSRPSAAAVGAFLRAYGIDYIYVDPLHLNQLVADAVVVSASGDDAILRVP